MNRNVLLVASWIVALAAMGVIWLGGDAPPSHEGSRTVASSGPTVTGPIQPLPQRMALDARKVSLGDRLFHDARLSRDGTISCASCHALDKGGADGRRVSLGVGGAEGDLNAPTVLNAVFNFRQYWDGRARDLHEQIDGPLTNPKEMGSSWEHVLGLCRTDTRYEQAFQAIYGGVAREHVEDAIAEFEKSLITPDSDFDRYLRGEGDAISPAELRGYELFVDKGCVSCHQGVNIGGNMFQTFGHMKDWFGTRESIREADFGRFNVTGRERDRFRFKVPTLRNIDLTAPYLHDGSVDTLEEAVQIMAEYELGARLAADEVRDIVAFLKSLTGRMPR